MTLRWLVVAALAGCAPAPESHSALDAPQAASARAACTFPAGTPASLTLARDARVGHEVPIDHVIVLMLEGRSFDHLLSQLPGADPAPADVANADASGQMIPRHPLQTFCMQDPPHDWNAQHLAWSEGRLDGFVRAGAPAEVMGYYTAADLPGLNAVAGRFAVAGRYHASALAPPAVNRAFLFAGTGFGHTQDGPMQGDLPTLFDALDRAGVDWRVYARVAASVDVLPSVRQRSHDRFQPYHELTNALTTGALPAVSFVDPLRGTYGIEREDFGAPGDIELGDDFLVHLVNGVMRSPAWPRTALFITFADHGGMYDHVAPPAACAPDALAPALGTGDLPGGFDRLGFRVPLLVVSPWVRPGFVSDVVYDHTSLLRFVESRFHLPALTARDANADPLSDLFDFDRPHLDATPLPVVPFRAEGFRHCDRPAK